MRIRQREKGRRRDDRHHAVQRQQQEEEHAVLVLSRRQRRRRRTLFILAAVAVSARRTGFDDNNNMIGSCCCVVVSAVRQASTPIFSNRNKSQLKNNSNSNIKKENERLRSSEATNTTSDDSSSSRNNSEKEPKNRVISLTETEVYDGRTWKAPGSFVSAVDGGASSKKKLVAAAAGLSHRWTDTVTGEISLPPDQIQAEQWVGDWKIVTASHRDEFGWEYEFSNQQVNRRTSVGGGLPTRKRIWLRTCIDYDDGSKSTSKAVTAKKKKKRRSTTATAASKLFQLIRDDFNFKGFGFSFYKSLVFGKSVGVAMRLPLTYNFGVWESHPGFPSLASSIGCFGPTNPTIGVFVSTSLRIEMIFWLFDAVVSTTIYSITWFLWTFFAQGIVLAISALLYPFTRKPIITPEHFVPRKPECWTIGPQYKRTVEERLGCSMSWRISVRRGFEFRKTVWHYYAPRLVSLLEYQRQKIQQLQSNNNKSPKRRSKAASIPPWMVRRVAALALSTSGPIPDEPYLTSSVLLSLSGFYFRKETSSRQSKLASLARTATDNNNKGAGGAGAGEEEETNSKSRIKDDEDEDIERSSTKISHNATTKTTSAKRRKSASAQAKKSMVVT